MKEAPIVIRSCTNCVHLESWYYPSTREEPGDEGSECTHEEGAWQTIEEYPQDCKTLEDLSRYTASQCPVWSFYDREKHEQDRIEAIYLEQLEIEQQAKSAPI
jgi:hypothetical protein